MNLSARTAAIASSVVVAALTGIAAPQVASAAPAAAPLAAAQPAATDLSRSYPTWTTLHPGTKDPVVEELQNELAAIGYPVKVTRVYDAQTKTAVLAVQRSAHLTADGVVGPATWRAIGVRYYPVLRIGSRGPAVVRLQRLLIGMDMLKGKADGYYGPATAAAVKQAQRNAGLPQTGISDVRVILSLWSYGC